jgi:hypothetical protein
MNMRVIMLTAIAVHGLAVFGKPEPESATLPYRALCQMAQLDLTTPTGFTNQEITFTVGSKNPAVKIEDISMFIDAKSRRIPLHISTNGILTLPVSADLASENPRIVSNQPKGSMELVAAMVTRGTLPESARRDKEGMIRYSALFLTEKVKQTVVNDLTEVQKEHDLKGVLSRPTVVHLQTRTEPESAEVIIVATNGESRLKPTAPGHFVVRFDPEMMKQDPWVKLSPNHEWSMIMETEDYAEPGAGVYRR